MKISARRARPDTYTKLLIKAFGANGSTTFKDFSQSGHTITANGNAQMSTTQAKFPPVSISLDGTGDYFSVPDHADFDFGSGDFTIHSWMRFNATGTLETIISQFRAGGTSNRTLYLRKDSADKIAFILGAADQTFIISMTGTTALSANTWYHIAIIRNGTTAKLFLDGTEDGSQTGISGTAENSTDNVLVGALWNSTGTTAQTFLNGYFDQMYVDKGIARWTANFTPPTRRS